MIDVLDLLDLKGTTHGPGPWTFLDQGRIDLFADATGDHQWIHQAGPAAEAGPFGGPIAHGYLALGLVASMWPEILPIEGVTSMVNYGLNRARFTAPVPAGSRLRLRLEVVDAVPVDPHGVQLTLAMALELDGHTKPALVAEPVYRIYA